MLRRHATGGRGNTSEGTVNPISALDFKLIELSDRDWMEECFRAGHRGSLEYSFTNLFVWRKVLNIRVAHFEGYAVVLADADSKPSYVFPMGTGPLLPVLEAMQQDAASRGEPLRFNTLLEEDRIRLEALYPGKFDIREIRWAFDYVYESERLINLGGKKLSQKRNNINKFSKEYRDWAFEEITPANMDEVRQMSRKWAALMDTGDDKSLHEELAALEETLDHYRELNMQGGLIRAGGRVIAFSIGDPLNDDVYLVQFEKAYPDIPGAYQVINQQFCEHFATRHKFVNREDDAGDEGLRKAKLSYDPIYLVAKYCAEEIVA